MPPLKELSQTPVYATVCYSRGARSGENGPGLATFQPETAGKRRGRGGDTRPPVIVDAERGYSDTLSPESQACSFAATCDCSPLDMPYLLCFRHMKRYAAFLRGVSPMNAKMSELRSAFEFARFTDVTTVLSSGNVVFGAPAASEAVLERKAEAAMKKHLGYAFLTIVRPVDALRRMLASDPYKSFQLKPGSKRVVTFLRRKPKAGLGLPIELGDSRILHWRGGEVFSAYVPSPRGPVFMTLIEKTLGTNLTTRTWETVMKVAK